MALGDERTRDVISLMVDLPGDKFDELALMYCITQLAERFLWEHENKHLEGEYQRRMDSLARVSRWFADKYRSAAPTTEGEE